MAKKIVDIDTNWAFPDSNSSLDSPMATKFRGHKSKKMADFDMNGGFSGLSLNFYCTDGFEMMQKA